MILESHERDVTDRISVQQALSTLPEDVQAMLSRLYFDDWTHAQVAVELGKTTAYVRRTEREALQFLRTKFDNE